MHVSARVCVGVQRRFTSLQKFWRNASASDGSNFNSTSHVCRFVAAEQLLQHNHISSKNVENFKHENT